MIKVMTLEESQIEEMLRRAAQFGATIALENFKPEPFPEIMDKQTVAKYLKFSLSKVSSLMKADLPHYKKDGETFSTSIKACCSVFFDFSGR